MTSLHSVGAPGARAGLAPPAADASVDRPHGARVAAGLAAFAAWRARQGPASQDQYDWWATRYGLWAKARFYRHGWPVAPLVAPLIGLDMAWPSARRWVTPPRRFAIADAHYVLGDAARHRATGAAAARAAAIAGGEALLDTALPGFAGPCWGYPFDWQTRRGLVRRGTPLITTTPYVFDAMLELHALTATARYRETALAIAAFVASDIRDTAIGGGLAASYTPFDRSAVVNASAYRAACLARAGALASNGEYLRLARANAQFVAEQQRGDGAWSYSANDPQDRFVDHIHTCFVLKGLYRTARALADDRFLAVVAQGFAYYRRALFTADGAPRPFAETPWPRLARLELYDCAEALNLALLLRDALPTAPLAHAMAAHLLALQLPNGAFVTRILRGGVRHRVPYHRWAQAQAYCALARYAEWQAVH